jgi:hypothetical protein
MRLALYLALLVLDGDKRDNEAYDTVASKHDPYQRQ